MADKRTGQTVRFQNPPSVVSYASIVGKKEGEGPLKKHFDMILEHSFLGEKSWEKAETRLQQEAFARAVEKSGAPASEIGYVFAGDLINQCYASAFSQRSSGIPMLGLYGACSTMAEGLGLAALSVDGGFLDKAAAITSSHYCSSERQFRMPLEYGGQRAPTAQWTATGSGAIILAGQGQGPFITHFTAGKVIDMGITDASNMGAAMAPAAFDTLTAFFMDTSTNPDDYDLIVTGDLGKVGHEILRELFAKNGVLFANLNDCGIMLFDLEAQDVHAGGSGCACSAVVLCGKILNDMRAGRLGKVLFLGTGALMSPTSTMQGESIPSISHLVCFSNSKN